MKTCSRCKAEKTASEFSRASKASDGLQSWCKACKAAGMREKWAADPVAARERKRAAAKKQRAISPEKVRATQRAYRQANIEQERAREAARRHDPARREWKLEYDRAWRERNRQEVRDRARKFETNARARRAGVHYVEDIDPQFVYERDLGICGICGDPVDREAFHVDHVVSLSRGGEHSYANVQLAHPGCNVRKGNVERGPDGVSRLGGAREEIAA